MLSLYLDEVHHVALVAVGLAYGADPASAMIRLCALDVRSQTVTLHVEDDQYLTIRRVSDREPAHYVYNDASWVWAWAKS